MADKVELSAAIRSNLLTLARTTDLIDRTQNRLSTGLKVSSALDDAAAFFAARGLSNRADDLNDLKSNIDQGISVIEAAIAGIEAITELIEQAKGLAIAAKATGDTNERSSLAVQFDALLLQIDSLSNDSTFGGTNLIQTTPDNLTVTFNEDGTSNLTIAGIDSSTGTAGINVAGAVGRLPRIPTSTRRLRRSITQSPHFGPRPRRSVRTRRYCKPALTLPRIWSIRSRKAPAN